MIFAIQIAAPDAVAVIEWAGVCYPFHDVGHARETAKSAGVAGFWRLKAKKPISPFPLRPSRK